LYRSGLTRNSTRVSVFITPVFITPVFIAPVFVASGMAGSFLPMVNTLQNLR
jgi:hypothetical protein